MTYFETTLNVTVFKNCDQFLHKSESQSQIVLLYKGAVQKYETLGEEGLDDFRYAKQRCNSEVGGVGGGRRKVRCMRNDEKQAKLSKITNKMLISKHTIFDACEWVAYIKCLKRWGVYPLGNTSEEKSFSKMKVHNRGTVTRLSVSWETMPQEGSPRNHYLTEEV